MVNTKTIDHNVILNRVNAGHWRDLINTCQSMKSGRKKTLAYQEMWNTSSCACVFCEFSVIISIHYFHYPTMGAYIGKCRNCMCIIWNIVFFFFCEQVSLVLNKQRRLIICHDMTWNDKFYVLTSMGAGFIVHIHYFIELKYVRTSRAIVYNKYTCTEQDVFVGMKNVQFLK